jgi:hypothetical protein
LYEKMKKKKKRICSYWFDFQNAFV